MKVSGSHVLPGSPEKVYQTLQDPEVLARSMPGCDELREVAPGEYEMRMKVAMASVQGLFSGKVHLRDPQPPESFRMVVEGSGKIGFLKGDGVLQLTPQGEGTLVSYSGDVQVGGVMAAVGQRLLDTTSKFMVRKFFESVAQQMTSAGGAAGA